MMATIRKGYRLLRGGTLRRGIRCFTVSSSRSVGEQPPRNESNVASNDPDLGFIRRTFVDGPVGAPSSKIRSKSIYKAARKSTTSGHPKDLEANSDAKFVVLKNDPNSVPMHPVWLRDACSCSRCVDPSTTQKNFQSTDIPSDIKASSIKVLENEVKISWKNDVPGFTDHVSIYPKSFFWVNKKMGRRHVDRSIEETPWDKMSIGSRLKTATYEQWMTDDDYLGRAMLDLRASGVFIVRGVPETETAVEDLGKRMGPIRDSLYGRTWDVKSVPDAKNVAYTQTHLGLHMDLLYMADPPGFQFLHCLQNSCEGGESIFVDAFKAASEVSEDDFLKLVGTKLAYHYKNAGEHYYQEQPVFETYNGPFNVKSIASRSAAQAFGLQCLSMGKLKAINYSPPFQSPVQGTSGYSEAYAQSIESLRAFAKRVEASENLFEYKLQPGECVVFNNRRILHGRKQFEAAGGQRWLKGAYVDTDAYRSRLRTTLESGILEKSDGITEPVFPEAAQ